jgi:VanZ family protein
LTNATTDSPVSSSSLNGSAAQRNLWRAWWPAVVWIGIIACESTDTFSSENTGTMLYRLLTWVFGPINLYDFLIFHHYLRKTGHVVGYGMLCLLLWRGWRATLERNYSRLGWTMTLAWLGTVFVASMDEWHQSFIPSRTGTPWDVLLDSVAGLGFLAAGWWWISRKPQD